MAEAVQEVADTHYHPTWERQVGEFTWQFEQDEPYPRGQHNGAMAAAEAMSEGAWRRLATVGPGDRFDESTVTGVDFANVIVTRANWDPTAESLHVSLAGLPGVSGRSTSFEVWAQLPPGSWTVDVVSGAAAALTSHEARHMVRLKDSIGEMVMRRDEP